MRIKALLAAVSIAAIAVPAQAQTTTQPTSTRDRITQILGNLLGVGNNADSSLDGQWRAGRTPLANQRAEFETRAEADVRNGRMNAATGARLKSDYYELVRLEAQYGNDRVYSQAERTELTTRYNQLLQVLADGRYAEGDLFSRWDVRDGQAEFNRRVDAQIAARRLTRTAGTRLKSDYAGLVRLEADYMRDGMLTDTERNDLDTRLDALDQRVGDVAYTAPVLTNRARLDAVAQTLPTSGLTAAARQQLLVEHADIVRLEAAYARLTPTAEERAYLESRIANLESRARVRR